MPSPSSPADGSGPSGELDYLTYKLDLIKTLATKAADPHYERASGLRIRELRVLRLLHASPGIVATDMWTRMDRDLAQLNNGREGDVFASRVANVPMGRAQTPQDVAGLALFLASPASDYMTGQSINIDGGLVLN